MALTIYEKAEMDYWRSVVRKAISGVDWRYPDDALEALLDGTANQEYFDYPAIKYPVMRYRQLKARA